MDEDGDVLDIPVQSRKNRRAAVRLLLEFLNRQGCLPRRLITEKLPSHPAEHRLVMRSVPACTDRYANNHAEASHQPTRRRERQIRRFKLPAHLQHFTSILGVVSNLFRVERYLSRSARHRLLLS